MSELRFTLLTEGSSDRALIGVLGWLLHQHLPAKVAVQPTWADLSRDPQRPHGLAQRIARAVALYPCDLLFVHRDADRAPRQKRIDEISRALPANGRTAPSICVVPVRMTEAWLLFNESAIRQAAGNPNGAEPLNLPLWQTVESMPSPKAWLHDAIRRASGRSARRLRSLSIGAAVKRIADLTIDFSPLRCLPAFQAVEADIRGFCADWPPPA